MSYLLVNDQRRTALPDGWADLLSHGRETYEWFMMDRQRRILGPLDGAEDGDLDLNVNADTRGTGSVTWTGRPKNEPDWTQIYLVPRFTLESVTGTTISWPLGVFMPATPTVQYSAGSHVSLGIELYDLSLRLRQQELAYEPYVAEPHSPLVAYAREVIGYAGLTHVIEDSDKLPRSPMVFMPGEEQGNFYYIVSKLLEAAGFFAPYADNAGIIRSEQYRRPSDRSVAWTFSDSSLAPSYDPHFSITHDWFAIPNRVIAFSPATGETEQLMAEAANTDPDDKLSMYNRGPVDEVVTVEITDQETLQTHAERLLEERRSQGSVLELEHFPLPLALNDRVDFRRDSMEVALKGVVQTMNIPCTPGSLWTTVVREVKT